MSDAVGVADDMAMNAYVDKSSAVTVGPGALLRSAREAQGLHIGALAVMLKIPVKKLEALESDRYDLLLDTVFVRALALSVCRALKVDARPVMAALPQLQAPAIKTDEVGLNASFKSTGSGFRIASVVQGMKPAGLVMLVLVMAIIAVYLWPTSGVPEVVVGDASPHDPALVAVTNQSKPTESNRELVASQANPARMTKLAEASQTSTPAVPAGVNEAMSLGVAVPVSAVASAGSPLSASLLTLQARGQSWVEVTDAQGNSQLRKTINAGELLQVSGVLPLSVVLGRADVVSVLVRGKPLDVTAFSKDNVARFEVQ